MIGTNALRPAYAFLLLLTAGLLASASARAETSVAVDVATGKVLSQNDPSARWYPASTTKLMTAYLAMQAIESGKFKPDAPVVMTRRAAQELPSKMGYPPGSVMRLDYALRMMLVKSANDIAVAIGQTIADGSLEGFVQMMNDEAARLGMKDSHFINPNGMPGDGQYSSAKDLAILAIALKRDFPTYSDFFSTEAFISGKAVIKNYNPMLGRYDGADGMKTGYICAGGYNLVASATRNGRSVVAVVLGAIGPISRARTAAELLENGFKAQPAADAPTVYQLPVSSGPAADVSDQICSAEGRKARAAESADSSEDTDEQAFGSPYLHDIGRPRVAIKLGLGGAAGTDTIEAGITLIAAYGIPVPIPRPAQPDDALHAAEAAAAAASAAASAKAAIAEKSAPPASEAAPVRSAADLGVTRRGIPIPRFAERATN